MPYDFALPPEVVPLQKARINPFIIAYLVALVTLAAVGYYVANFELRNDRQTLEDRYFATDLAFYDLPRVNLTLSSSGLNSSGNIRMDISLEVAQKDLHKLQDYQPRIMDTVIKFMQQYDANELKPADAMPNLHENLLNEVNLAARPIPVRNIVVRQFVIQ